VPISLVSLIDRDRQWFKARYGIGVKETPREHAFCAHAIKSDELYVVPDASQNPLFSANPLVTGAPDIRFYAGAPLITPDKFRLGTLCVIDNKPRQEMSQDARVILALLARMVVNALESRRQTLRAQHQMRMMTRLAENTVAVSQAKTYADAARLLTEGARGLVVADVAHLQFLGAHATNAPITAARESAAASTIAIDWTARGDFLQKRSLVKPATASDLPPALKGTDTARGAWIGFLLGMDGSYPVGHFQLWRQHTSSFTELETAMLTDLARVASAVMHRLAAH